MQYANRAQSDEFYFLQVTTVATRIKVNEIEASKHTPILITVIGGEAFDLMVDLCNPANPEDKKFEDLVKLMQNHLQPQPSEIAERYKFRQRKQDVGKSVAVYMANLKKLAKDCKFGEKLEENLRDQLVFGLKSETTRQRLFVEKSLTFQKAQEIAVGVEAAETNSHLIAGTSSVAAVHKLQATRRRVACKEESKEKGQRSGYRRSRNGGPPLIGRDWLKKVNISIDNIFHIDNQPNRISKMLIDKFPGVFDNDLGKFNGGKAKLYLKENTVPIYRKARPLPFALTCKVEEELNNLIKLDILNPVNSSEWATPIVPVLKKNGQVAIWGSIQPIGIFHQLIENIFAGIDNVGIFLDGILIASENEGTHIKTLMEVFHKLSQVNLKIQVNKCSFATTQIQYLGFIVDKEGIHTDPIKMEAIKKVKVPQNVTQLRAFLGLVNYYGKFLPGITNILYPLYKLLRKNEPFQWQTAQQGAFEKIKSQLMSSKVLVHYNPQLPIILAVDASAYGIAAVISHKFDNGDVKPIAYASRTLSSAEKSYSQIDKEALAIVYGVKKFHQFLYGRSFTLLTDHKPLISIFGDKKGIPIFAASRLQRWSVILFTYNFKIKFINSESNGNADALSRLPIEINVRDEVDLGHILYIEENIPINHQDIAAECKKDPVLNRIIGFCLGTWVAA
ncbi:uncharacterized protein LOC116167045 [Photinus pyralis]|uniref:uncharacterized protein LOC116167045 n=1 Tax=Photinus pyralis TaxID=7054 RepID=UPI00126716B0|nr:uncharacterized protein LOC116167045 [Photinus pyralis]